MIRTMIPLALGLLLPISCSEHSKSQLMTSNMDNISGVWSSQCMFANKPDKNGQQIDKTTRIFKIFILEDRFEIMAKEYLKADCKEHALTSIFESTFQLQAPDEQGISKIDYTVKSIRLAFHKTGNGERINEINDIPAFGFNDWKYADSSRYEEWKIPAPFSPEDGRERNISGKKLSDDPEENLPALPAKGDKIFDLVQRDGDQLYFGLNLGKDSSKQNSGRTEETRPTTINKTVSVSKN